MHSVLRIRLKFGKIYWDDLLCTKMEKNRYRKFDNRGTLNYVLFFSLQVQAVELFILVKPISILAHVLMSMSFGAKILTFLNISVLPKVVGISVMFLVFRFSIMSALNC